MTAGCAVCKALGTEVSWGEVLTDGGYADLPRPAVFERLVPADGGRRHCPVCANVYLLEETSWSFLNADYEGWALRRLRPSELGAEAPSAWARVLAELADEDPSVRESAARILSRELLSDPAEFERLLLAPDDAPVRCVALRALSDADAPRASGLGPWEARLRALLTDRHVPVRTLAGELLARHLQAARRSEEALALVENANGAALVGALLGLRRSPSNPLPGPVYLRHAERALLAAAREPSTATLASLTLSRLGQGPGERRLLASIWQRAVEHGHRLPPGAVTELLRALADAEARDAAVNALRAAARCGLSVAGTLPQLALSLGCSLFPGEQVDGLVARLREVGARAEPLVLWLTALAEQDASRALHWLDQLQQDRVDVALATETLKRLSAEACPATQRAQAERLLGALGSGPRPLDGTGACDCQAGGPPAAMRFLTQLSQTVHEGWSEESYRCGRCGRTWRVEEDSSYHFTTYNWRQTSPVPAPRPRAPREQAAPRAKPSPHRRSSHRPR